MRSQRLVLFGLVTIALSSSTALADDACEADRKKLCGDFLAHKGHNHKDLAECMQGHEAELSDSCKQQRIAVMGEKEEVHESCKADVQKLCSGVKPGHWRVRECLKQHDAELSPACKQSRANMRELQEEIHPDCRPDIEKLCKEIQPGGGRVMACLEPHLAELSPGCRSRIEKREQRKVAK